MNAPDPWNGYRPPLRWYDRPLLWALLGASVGIVIGLPLWWLL